MCLLSLTNETEIQKKKTVHCLAGKLLNVEAKNQRAFAERGRGCFPGFFRLQTDHPLLLYHCSGRYKKYKIGFSTKVKSLKINSLTNLSLERNSVLLITFACLYMCNMLPAKVLLLDKHTAHLMKY